MADKELIRPTDDTTSLVDAFEEGFERFDDVLVDMDEDFLELDAIESIVDPNQSEEQLAENTGFEAGYEEMRQTFLAIMQQVLKPVTRYMKAVSHGEESREVFEIMNFTVTPLIDKVEQVELGEHRQKLVKLKTSLSKVLATHFGVLSPEMRDEVLEVYDELCRAFELDFRGNRRAVQNVLSFYRLMCFDTQIDLEDIKRFFAVGIPSITWVRRTSAKEISSLSGIALAHCKRLKEIADCYREPPQTQEEGEVVSLVSPTIG